MTYGVYKKSTPVCIPNMTVQRNTGGATFSFALTSSIRKPYTLFHAKVFYLIMIHNSYGPYALQHFRIHIYHD